MTGTFKDFLKALGIQESPPNGDYKAVNQFGFLGMYQFGESSLVDIGFYKSDSTPNTNDWQNANWTGKDGIRSKQQFLNSPAAQEDAIQLWMAKLFGYISSIVQYDGQTINGIQITLSGLLAGAHLVGAGRESSWLSAGEPGSVPVDGNGTKITTYIQKFGGYTTPFTINHDLPQNLLGSNGADSLHGGAGADTLNGGAGADTMAGGPGNDTYYVDNAGDVVTESINAGVDLVNSSISYVLPTNVENLALTGSLPINGTGNSLGNTITGNSGNNVLDSGAGADTLIGGGGNDTYIVDNAGDTSIEKANEGVDLVSSSVTYTLGANIENLTLTGSAAINGTGNSQANVIVGNSGNNALTGGAGSDTLTGNAGSDTFVFTSKNDGLDTITDFTHGTDFLGIAASGFGGGLSAGHAPIVQPISYPAPSAETHTGPAGVFFLVKANDGSVLYWDSDGGSGSNAVAIANLSHVSSLVPADFHII